LVANENDDLTRDRRANELVEGDLLRGRESVAFRHTLSEKWDDDREN